MFKISAWYPGSSLPCAKAGCYPQTCRSHGEVADEVPYQAGNLHKRRDEGQDSAVKLWRVEIKVSDIITFNEDIFRGTGWDIPLMQTRGSR